MRAASPSTPQPFSPFDPRGAIGRLLYSAVVLLVGFEVLTHVCAFGIPTALLGGWDASALFWLARVWWTIARLDAEGTRERARAEDPGRRAAYSTVVVVSIASMVAGVVLSRRSAVLAADQRVALVAFCFVAIASAWTVTHTSFTLRYAHMYYRDDREGVGGVSFAGDEPPSYFDFAYLAFTIGMCFQVSDMSIPSPQIRRAVLAQALISFAFNSILLAFVLNLMFTALE